VHGGVVVVGDKTYGITPLQRLK